MNTIKISAVLTAALLTGALSATAFAAETLTTTTGSITFRKAIDVTNAAGAGGITGTIAFDVTAADESDLPDDGEKNYVGSVDQLDGSDITATFAADDGGIANKESDVSVGFDTSKFEAPGIYYYHLTERDPGIHGLNRHDGDLPAQGARCQRQYVRPGRCNVQNRLRYADLAR